MGLGRKLFTRERATVADVQGYLMDQSVMVFASASARTAAIGTPDEGMVTYLTSTKRYEGWDGTAWRLISGGTTVALPPATGWAADSTEAPGIREMSGELLVCSGIMRRTIIGAVTAEANVLFSFTAALPTSIRATGNRYVGIAGTPVGWADIYYLSADIGPAGKANTLAFSYRQNTTVYDTSNWFIGINSLHYFR